MPVSDPIADLLTRMRNAQHVRKESCVCPWSRHKEELCEVLQKEGFIESSSVEGEGKEKMITVTFNKEHPKLTLTRSSKPGRRVYVGKGDLKPHLRGFGISVVTTSKGLMTDKKAREAGVGGEVLCTVS